MSTQDKIKQLPDGEREQAKQKWWERINAEWKAGNVVFMGIEGPMVAPLADFITQPTDGILYDLNRLEEVVGTFLDDPKWLNDFAVCKTIRALKDENARLVSELEAKTRALEAYANPDNWSNTTGPDDRTLRDYIVWNPPEDGFALATAALGGGE